MDVKQEEALSKCNFIINHSGEAMVVCRSIIDCLESRLSYRRGCVVIRRPSDGRVAIFAHSLHDVPKGSEEVEISRVNRILARQNTGVINAVVDSDSSLIVNDALNCEMYVEGCEAIKSELCVPLTVRGETFGAINFESGYRAFYDHHDGLLLQSLANQIALLIDRENLNRTFEETNLAFMTVPLQAQIL